MTTTNLTSVITEAHRELEALLQELESGTTSPEHRRQLADHLITELVAHTVAEEQYLYPAVRQYLPDGSRIAKARLKEHAEAEAVMTELQNISPAEPKFELLVSTLIADARRHIDNDLLSQLDVVCPAAKLCELGEKFLDAKQNAPGMPHPAAAERKSGKLVLEPGGELVAKVRTALTRND
jgi:hypothetical protein